MKRYEVDEVRGLETIECYEVEVWGLRRLEQDWGVLASDWDMT